MNIIYKQKSERFDKTYLLRAEKRDYQNMKLKFISKNALIKKSESHCSLKLCLVLLTKFNISNLNSLLPSIIQNPCFISMATENSHPHYT